ncbi:MAG: CDP-archaeol synthase [Gammaproteobacteria bacterium]|nr:CDP-archaeol synthase [Gammaproteobacteria bacterium]
MLSAHLQAIALLIGANAAPVILSKLLRERPGVPLDLGYRLPDGQRLFGDHKTWRGLLTGIAVGALLSKVLGMPAWVGAGFAAASLLGDALSSAIKRRLHLRPGTEIPVLDQVGEALLPLILFAGELSLEPGGIAIVTTIFILLDLSVTRLRHAPWLDPAK